MPPLTTRRCTITCLVLVALAAATLFGMDRFGLGSRRIGPVGTIRASGIVKLQVDDPTDAYRVWRDARYRGRTVVYVSGKWESFDPGDLIPVQMFRAYPLQLYNTARFIEETQLNATTFLYVATLKGICRQILAIVPPSEVARMGGVARTAKDATAGTQAVFISRQGFPRWFMTAAAFRGGNEPVLLYVAASYFKTVEPEELFHRLVAAGLRTDCIILCTESANGSVTPAERAKLDRFSRLIGLSPPTAVQGGGAP